MAALLSLHNQKHPNINLMPHSHEITHRLLHQENHPLFHQDSQPLNHQESQPLHHQENHPLLHQENHRLFKVNSPDEKMIQHVGLTDDGADGRGSSGSGGCRSLETDFQTSFPDYDNLLPAVRLDESEEKKTGGNGSTIDNAFYDNCATNNTHAVWRGFEEGEPSNGCGRRVRSDDRFETENDRISCRGCACCRTDQCGNVVVGVKCDSVVGGREMGNDFVGNRSDSASDAGIAEDLIQRENTNLDNSNQDKSSGVCFNSYTANILSGERYIDDNIPETLNLLSFLVHSSGVDIKCENLSEKSDNAMEKSRTETSGLPSVVKIGGDNYDKNSNSNSVYGDNKDGDPVTGDDRFSQSGLLSSGKNDSFTSSFGKGGHFNSKTINITQHVAFEDRYKLIDSTQSNLEKTSSSGRDTLMETTNVSAVGTPAIIITPSTPKNKPSMSSTAGTSTDTPKNKLSMSSTARTSTDTPKNKPSMSSTARTSSDLPKKQGTTHQTQASNAGEKQTQFGAKTTKKSRKNGEKKRDDVGVKTINKTAKIHAEKQAEIGAKTRKIATNKSLQNNAEVGAMEETTTNEITEEKLTKTNRKSTGKCEGKQTKIDLNTNKKHSEDATSSPRSKNSKNVSDNKKQKQPQGSTCQSGTNASPPAHTYVCLNSTLSSEQLTTDAVCKIEATPHQTSGSSESETGPSSHEDSKNRPILTENGHKETNINPTLSKHSVSLNSGGNIDKEKISTCPTSLNSDPDLGGERATPSSSLAHYEEKIVEPAREGNCDTYSEIPGSTRETNVFRLFHLNAKGEIINNFKDDVVISRFASTDTGTKIVEEDTSLTEPDVESLLESHYMTIPVCNKGVACKEGQLVDAERTQRGVTRVNNPTLHIHVPDELDSGEDIYAIPIPKSLRKVASSHARNSPQERELEKGLILEEKPLPLRPPRSPNTASQQIKTSSIDTDHPAPTHRAEVTCHIQKSSTTDTLNMFTDDYDYSNVPKYGRYNFFSLGRRPKIMRTVGSKDRKPTAVNLEMMLRFRRQSLTDIPSTTAADERLSVEEILQSCTEFERSNVFYRNRTSSDSTHNSSWYSTSVFGALNNYSKIDKIEETEKHQKQVRPLPFTSILKKSNNGRSGHRSILKRNNNQESGSALHVKKINFADEAGESEDGNRRDKLDRRLRDTGKGVPASSFSSSEDDLIGQNDLEGANQKPVLKTSKVAFIGQDDLELANEKSVFKVSQKHSKGHLDLISETETGSGLQFNEQYRDTDCDIHSDKRFIKDSRNDYTPGSSNNPKILRDHFPQNSDYDSLENAGIVYSPSTRSSFLPKEDAMEGSGDLDYKSAVREVPNTALQFDSPSFSSQYFGQNSENGENDTGSEIEVSPENVKSFAIKPTHANTQREPLGRTSTSLSTRFAHKAPTSPETPSEFYRPIVTSTSTSIYSTSDHPSPIMWSPDVTGSLSPNSVFSDSPDDSSPEVMSSLSVDVFTDPSLWDVQSPTQKSPTYNAKLEVAEALKWLRAAGFPQYAQMFVEGQFPVDMCVIEKDHDFLDPDSLKTLFRRLQKLNKYAGLSVDTASCKKVAGDDDGDDEYMCALSDRWEYHKPTRRWTRKDVTSSPIQSSTMGSDPNEVSSRSGSNDSLLDHDTESQPDEGSPRLEPKRHDLFASQDNYATLPKSSQHSRAEATQLNLKLQQHARSQDMQYASTSPLQNRASNDKNKSTKGLFKRMEGFKPKRSRGQAKRPTIKEISGPIVDDSEYLRAKLERLNCVDISSKTQTLSSPSSLLDRSFRRSSTDIEDRNTSLDISPNQISPRSPLSSASTKSQSDLVSRSSETTSSSRYGLTLKNQHASCHNLKSSQVKLHDQNQHPFTNQVKLHDQDQHPFTNNRSKETTPINVLPEQRNDAQKILPPSINLEGNAKTQDLPHQSGRFPLDLPNGRIDTTTTSTTLSRSIDRPSSRDTGLMPGSMLTFPSKNRALNHRKSIYDNILSSELNFEEQEPRMIFPGIYELRKGVSETVIDDKNEEFVPEGFEVRKHRFFRDVNPELNQRNTAYITNSGLPVSQTSERHIHRHIRERSVSFETNLYSQSPKESTKRSEGEKCSIDSETNKRTGYESFPSKSRGISYTSSPVVAPKEISLGIEAEISCIDSRSSTRLGSEQSPAKSRGISYTSSPVVSPKEISLGIEAEISSIDSRSSTRTGPESSPSKSRGIFHSSSADSYFRGDTSSSRDGVSFGNNNSEGAASKTVLKKEYEDLDVILQQLYHNIDELTSYMSKEQPESRSSQGNTSFGVYGTADLDTETSLSGGEGSTTAGSSSEDPELVLTDTSRDNSFDHISDVTRERNDSGVGHSLPRTTSERQRKKIRWHSFQKSHRPAISSRNMQMNSLTVCQMVRLQKLSLLRLTGIMEKCLPISRSGWNWLMPRFLKKQKITDFSEKKVFGVPFSVMTQRTGQPLPQCVLYAMRYLRRNCSNAVGIFRKSGVKSKIQQLRDDLEHDPDTVDFEGMNAYNVADMLKTYFRDLPECLLTNKMSEIFRSIYIHVPQAQRLEAIQTAIVLLPDENREVLQSVLLFLSDVSSYEADHQMNASNLAVCFTPTVFQLGPEQVAPHSPKRGYKNAPAIPDPREILEQKAAHECLLMMILECKKLFSVNPSLYQQVQGQCSAHMKPVPLQDIGTSPLEVRAFGQERIQVVLKEAHDKNRGWIQILTDSDVEVFCRKPLDDCPLKEWKLVVEIEAPPIEVLHRIMHERHVWDEDLLNWSVVEKLGPHSDVFQFVLNSMAPHPCRHFCVLRYWRSDLNKGACALITMSVDHVDAMEESGVAATDLGSYFLMEPCGSGRSRLTHITRMDTRGRAPEWYTRIFGHFCANFLDRLRESFRQVTSGPETRV